MVTPDDHGCADLAPLHQLVQRAAELCPLPLAQPADARGQALERHPLLREPDPAMQVLVLGEELEHRRSVRCRSPASPESATHRNGPLPSQNRGRMYSGTKPGMSNASVTPASRAWARMLLP